jgi:hypothetical protein
MYFFYKPTKLPPLVPAQLDTHIKTPFFFPVYFKWLNNLGLKGLEVIQVHLQTSIKPMHTQSQIMIMRKSFLATSPLFIFEL